MVGDVDSHARSEFPFGNFDAGLLKGIRQGIDKCLSHSGIGCLSERRSSSLANTPDQGELTDQHDRSTRFRYGSIHAALPVGEYPKIEDLVDGSLHVRLTVSFLNPHQETDTGSDSADYVGIDGHGGAVNSLKDNPHRWILAVK